MPLGGTGRSRSVASSARREAYADEARATPAITASSDHSRATSRWTMPLTQPGPSDWRPSTRASVASSPATTASRRSGPSHLETDRTAAQRSRPGSTSVCHGVPATGPRWSSSITSTSSDERGAQVAGARGVHRRAARVVAPRRQHDRPGARSLGGLERAREHPARVDGDAGQAQAERAGEVVHAGPARILDGDGVAGGEVGREHPLDPVERAVDRAQAPHRHTVGRQRRAGDRGQLGQHRLVRRRCGAGASSACRAGSRAGSSATSGLPVTRSRAPSGTDPAARAGRSGGRSATRVPLRGRETTTPRRRSSASAAATVVGLTSSALARRRTEGSGSPAASRPAVTADSTLAAISFADEPEMRYCSDTVNQL